MTRVRGIGTKVVLVIVAAVFPAVVLAAKAAPDGAAPNQEQPVDLDSLEEAVDLDSLEEDTSAGKGGAENEPLLPITVTNVEVEQNSWLLLVALTVLVPVAAMLFPPKRGRRKKPGTAARNKQDEKKET